MIIPVFLGVLLIVFAINKVSGDPVHIILPPNATDAQRDALRVSMGLDKPFFVQYYNYVKGVVTKFDLGNSYSSNRPIRDEVIERYPTSLELALVSVCISVIIDFNKKFTGIGSNGNRI